jgi:hypothetical protein
MKEKEDNVCRLHKTLYMLKQAPKVWSNKIKLYFHQNGFEKCQSEPSFYVKKD